MEKGGKRGRFASGVLLLTAAGILVKILGLLYKIPLVSLLGDGGMGYFNSAYTIYIFCYTLSTAGLPAAVSILVAERLAVDDPASARALRRRASLLFTGIGLLLGGGIYLFSPALGRLIGNPAAARCIAAIAPVLPLSCAASVWRGYFQGKGEMAPTALSQLLEALGKLCCGLLFAFAAIHRGGDALAAAAAAVWGLFAATLLSLLSLLLVALWRSEKAGKPKSAGRVPMRRLLHIALPAAVSSSVMSLSGLLDLGTVMRRLTAAGYSEALANTLYGNYTGLAVPLFNLPPVLISPIAAAVLPYLSAALAGGRREEAAAYTARALRLALLIGTPCAMGLSTLSAPVLRLLFPAASAELAAPLLTILAPGCLFLGLCAVCGALLQAYGYPRLPLLSMLVGCALKLLCSRFLIGRLGMAAVPLGTLLCYAVAAGLDLLFLFRKTGFSLNVSDYFRPLPAGLCCVAGAKLMLALLPESRFAVLPAIFCGALLYGFTLLLLREPTLRTLLQKKGPFTLGRRKRDTLAQK